MVRKEQAAQQAAVVKKKLELVEFCIENDDVLLLSGNYSGQTVRQLWPLGPVERDYIVQKIWFTNNPDAVRIINELCAD